MTRRGVRTLRAGGLLLLGVALGCSSAAAQEGPVIPPGQEDLVSAMLRLDPPEPCRLTGASIDRSVIHADYHCTDEDVTVELRHPDRAAPGYVRTGKLALGVSAGRAPPELLPKLQHQIRAREADFRWVMPASEPGRSTAGHRPLWHLVSGPILALLLLAIAVRRFPPDPGAPPSRAPASRGVRLALAGLIVGGLALRAAAVFTLGMDTDEPSSVQAVHIPELFGFLEEGIHPPGYTLVVYALTGPPGPGWPPLWAQRLPSLIASAVSLLLVFRIMRPVTGARAALLPVALLAVTPFDVFIAALGRPYALAAAGMLLMVSEARPAIDGHARGISWVRLALAAGLVMWVDYLAFAAACVGLVALMAWRRHRRLPVLAPTGLMVAVLAGFIAPFVPVLLHSVPAIFDPANVLHTASLSSIGRSLGSAIDENASAWTGGLLSALWTGLLLGWLVVSRRRSSGWLAVLLVLAAAAGIVLLGQLTYVRPRNAAFMTPLVAMAAAVALLSARLPRRACIGAVVVTAALRLQQMTALCHVEDPTGDSLWSTELRAAEDLSDAVGAARRLAPGVPWLVDARNDDQAVLFNLTGVRTRHMLPGPDDPRVRAGELPGAVRGCRLLAPELERLDDRVLYLRRKACADPVEAPAGWRCVAGPDFRTVRIYDCSRSP